MSMCFMTGHAEAPSELLPQIMEMARRLIEEWDVTQFVVGRYGNFDRLAAQAVRLLKERYSHIQLVMLLPYYSAHQKVKISNGFDGTLYPESLETVPRRYAIVKANRLAINGAEHLILYQCYNVGNTYRLMKYAQSIEKRGKLHIWRVGACS